MSALVVDYFDGKPPGEATQHMIKRHLNDIVKNIFKDMQAFSLKIHLKEKTLCQLYNLIVCAEGNIKPHVAHIMKDIVYKFILDEDPDISQRAYKIAELLGLYVRADYLIPLMINDLTNVESRNIPLFV